MLRSNNRAASFRGVEPKKASGILTQVLQEHNVYLGGASVGKGLQKAARFHLTQQNEANDMLWSLPGAQDLDEGCLRPTNGENDDDGPPSLIEDSFYVVDLGMVVSQVYQWRKYFPRVEPFYAVKCNPNPVIIQTLAILGCNFDCASRGEIRLVQEVSRR